MSIKPALKYKGLLCKEYERLIEEYACDQIPEAETFYVIVPAGVRDETCEALIIRDEKIAQDLAQGISCGNIDHFILTVTSTQFVQSGYPRPKGK